MFCSVFYAFDRRRKSKEDYMEVGERMWELDYKIVKIMFSLEDGCLEGVNLHAQKQWLGLA